MKKFIDKVLILVDALTEVIAQEIKNGKIG